MKENEWKELEIGNLPPDILVGDYEFEYVAEGCPIIRIIDGLMERETYRYRKRQPKAPSHEERMTLLWEDDYGCWVKIDKYRPANASYYFQGCGVHEAWFKGRKSATIPPEAEK